MADLHFYTAYGLTFASEVTLPMTVAEGVSESDADVHIRVSLVDDEWSPQPDPGCYSWDGQEARLSYEDIGEIHVRGGTEIQAYTLDEVDPGLLRQLFIGVSTGIILHQRGYLTLHASGVEMDGGAVAFMGWKRMGKSTTSAAFHTAGHPLISDDTIVFGPDDARTVLPGVRQFKLDPVAVSKALGLDPETVPRMMEQYERRIHKLDDDAEVKPLPLKAVFILAWRYDADPDRSVAIEPLPAADAFRELATHSYAQRFLGNGSGTPEYLAQLADLAQSGLLARLVRPPTPDALPEIVEAVETYVRGKDAPSTHEPRLETAGTPS